jgi:hypothetical protein
MSLKNTPVKVPSFDTLVKNAAKSFDTTSKVVVRSSVEVGDGQQDCFAFLRDWSSSFYGGTSLFNAAFSEFYAKPSAQYGAVMRKIMLRVTGDTGKYSRSTKAENSSNSGEKIEPHLVYRGVISECKSVVGK